MSREAVVRALTSPDLKEVVDTARRVTGQEIPVWLANFVIADR